MEGEYVKRLITLSNSQPPPIPLPLPLILPAPVLLSFRQLLSAHRLALLAPFPPTPPPSRPLTPLLLNPRALTLPPPLDHPPPDLPTSLDSLAARPPQPPPLLIAAPLAASPPNRPRHAAPAIPPTHSILAVSRPHYRGTLPPLLPHHPRHTSPPLPPPPSPPLPRPNPRAGRPFASPRDRRADATRPPPPPPPPPAGPRRHRPPPPSLPRPFSSPCRPPPPAKPPPSPPYLPPLPPPSHLNPPTPQPQRLISRWTSKSSILIPSVPPLPRLARTRSHASIKFVRE